MKTIKIKDQSRACNGCTACCDGWLNANINGTPMYRGRRCQWVGEKGCEIYSERPKDPCHTYRCIWLDDKNVPHWMKPSLANVILSKRKTKHNEIEYIEMLEMGKQVDSTILNWVLQRYILANVNIRYQVGGGWNCVGTKEFVEALNEDHHG